jgi:nucleotide-binding universal stress UspA family protein
MYEFEKPTEPPRSLQVVVAYDFSPSAEEAVLRAVELACRAPQHILHILAAIDPSTGMGISPPTQGVDWGYAESIQKLVTARLVAAFAGRSSASEVQFFVHARIGPAADEVLQLAEEIGADLILIGSHSRTGLERLVLGSVSERVVRQAKCAVIVARAKRYSEVALAKIVDFEHTLKRHPPHRYAFVDRCVITRPPEWPA